MRKIIFHNLNDAQAQLVIEDFVDDGCTATKTKQPDNHLWTVEALCPEERAV